ncbi:hypothetical protein [Proteus myxofaciens]|uniref:ATP-binding component of an ABC superfamily transporter n=1 Tax=Proteus myxofaciens ATCC 19692 TaxID=1354337 RepID=A0A198G187_9GAMM|nr:hypothetical protein [Proteus myxofaciens]OAT30499.1 ATP-binding component of an ABC superfamily transporter [Proteus myxofaciens ATCC 19692]
MIGIQYAEQLPIISLLNINKSIEKENRKYILLKEITLIIKNNSFIVIRYNNKDEINALNNISLGIDIDYSGFAYLLGYYLPSLNNNQRARLRAKLLSFIDNKNHVFGDFNVFDNIYYSLLTHKSKKELNMNIMNSLSYMDIEHYYKEKIKNIPSDLLLNVVFARAIARKPKLIIMDYFLDDNYKEDFQVFIKYLHRINKDFNIPILLTTNTDNTVVDITQHITLKQGTLYYE